MRIIVRTCINCRKKGKQKSFFRIGCDMHSKLGMPQVIYGRSAYICKTYSCVKGIFEKKRLERSLKQSINEQDKRKLKEELYHKTLEAINLCKLK